MNTHRFRGLLLIAARAVVRRVSHRRAGGNVPDRPTRHVPSRHLLRLPGPCGHRRNRDILRSSTTRRRAAPAEELGVFTQRGAAFHISEPPLQPRNEFLNPAG